MIDKPFVSLVVRSYQAERFIKEAIDGALNQTYENLEIIFSDDASKDKTFEIIKEAVKNYIGPHRIILNRNEKNLGIGDNFNKVVFEIAKGDWIVIADGDDISLPNRVERLMQFADEDVAAIHHNGILINENSEEIFGEGNYKKVLEIFAKNDIEETVRRNICLRGATMCLNKKMINLFGELNKDIVHEDVVFAYRSQYFGKIIHLDDQLIKYREHYSSTSYNHTIQSFDKYVFTKQRDVKKLIATYYQILEDNSVMNLSSDFLNELSTKNKLNKVDLFLYSNGLFEPRFLMMPSFYKNAVKKQILRLFYLLNLK